MPGIELGMVCFKTTGRRAGKRVVVVGFDKKTGMAIVEGEAEKPRKCNVLHLWPTQEKISVESSRQMDYVPETEKKKAAEEKKPKAQKKFMQKKEKIWHAGKDNTKVSGKKIKGKEKSK